MKTGYSTHGKSEVIRFRLESEQKEKLEQRAKRFNMTVSEALREAVSNWFVLNSSKGNEEDATILS